MSSSGSDKDLRHDKRVDASLEVDYSTYSPYHLRRITNISRGGLFIRSQEIFPVGTNIDIVFKLPGHDKPIQSKVKVVWTYRQPSSVSMNSSGMGVQFLEINANDKQAIQSYIDNAGSEAP